MKSRTLTALLAVFGMLVLILDAKTALSGAAEGIELCIRSVIPSLFPFFVLSILLINALSGLKLRLLRPIGRLCGIPEGTESVLAVGLLGGYPVGAQSVAQLYRAGQISKSCAQRLLRFCNNAGPSFLFGIVAHQFSKPWMVWAIWGIHITSALIVGAFYPNQPNETICVSDSHEISFSDALKQSVVILSQVCGWIIIFRVFITFLDVWILCALPKEVQIFISGVLELTNGCCQLDQIQSEELRFIFASAMLAFGGLCVTMQTASVAEDLGIKSYIGGKLMQSAISICLSYFVMHSSVIMSFGLVFAGILCHELKNKGRNSAAVGV